MLTDISMPLMDGPRLISSLKAIDPDVRVIAMSGLMRPDQAGHLDELGIASFLAKPFSSETLLTALETALSAD